MRRRNQHLAPVIAAAFALGSFGTTFAENGPDAKFLTEAIRSDIGEIKLAELAQQRGQSAAVRDLGEQLAEQHAAAMQNATDLANELDVIPPTQPSAAATKKHEALSKLSGAEFDRAFVAEIIAAHEAEIAKLTAQAETGGSAVAKLAANTLPTQREHLAKAQSLRSELIAATSGG